MGRRARSPAPRATWERPAGVAADGRVVAFARFESEDAARANSERPEQGAWWAETEKLLDGPVEFSESSDVDDVPRRRVGRCRLRAGDEGRRRRPGEGRGGRPQFEPLAAELRPDLIGGLRVWTGPDSMIEANYFTSEAAAREGETDATAARGRRRLRRLHGDDEQGRVRRLLGSVPALRLTRPPSESRHRSLDLRQEALARRRRRRCRVRRSRTTSYACGASTSPASNASRCACRPRPRGR